MSDDLPTPPLPDATAITRQSRGRRIDVVALGRAAAKLRRQRLPLLGRHHAEEREKPRTPGTAVSASSTCRSNESRSGQPAIVSTIVSETTPSVDLDVPHHVELGDRPLELGVDDPGESGEDRFARGLHLDRA